MQKTTSIELPVVPGWPRYKCHKVVQAFKIHNLIEHGDNEFMVTGLNVQDGTFVFNGEWGNSHQPKIGGYIVRYEDGYYSYSPEGAFESGYTLVPHSSQTSPDPAIPWNRSDPPREIDKVAAIIEERGKVDGDPESSHANIGLAWTALLQRFYNIKLTEPIPAHLVAMMMVQLKLQRGCVTFHDDSFLDANAFLRFAEQFQKPKSLQS